MPTAHGLTRSSLGCRLQVHDGLPTGEFARIDAQPRVGHRLVSVAIARSVSSKRCLYFPASDRTTATYPAELYTCFVAYRFASLYNKQQDFPPSGVPNVVSRACRTIAFCRTVRNHTLRTVSDPGRTGLPRDSRQAPVARKSECDCAR